MDHQHRDLRKPSQPFTCRILSDFLFSARPGTSAALARLLERFLAATDPVIDATEGEWGSLAVLRAPHDQPRTLVEDVNAITVLVGDPIVRSGSQAPGVSSIGDRRITLHDMLARGEAPWEHDLDGHFAILHIDRKSRIARIATDRFAFIPVFSSTDKRGNAIVVGTHVDAVARAADRGRDIDAVSAVDILDSLTCTVPHTLYEGVRHEPAAAVLTAHLETGLRKSEAFWQPEETGTIANRRDAAAMLRDALAGYVLSATRDAGDVGILLSGGADSRVVLAALPPGVRAHAWTFADRETREVRIASRVARAYGATFEAGMRSPDHYIGGFEPVASMIGTHHMLIDVHSFGFHRTLGIRDRPVVLGGLSSDSLLKGAYSRRTYVPSNVPPIDEVIRPELLREAHARRRLFRQEMAAMRPRSADEWVQLWPFAMRKHGGNVDGNRRLFASHEAFHAGGVLEVAAASPIEWKRGRRLFHDAMKPFLRRTRFVPHSAYNFPAFGRAANLVMVPPLAAARGTRAIVKGETRMRQAPWPKWSSVVKSDRAREIRAALPLSESPLAGIFRPGMDPEREVDSWYSLRRLLLMQLRYVTSLEL